MRKIILGIVVVLAFAVLTVGCITKEATETEAVVGVEATEANPLVIDVENKSVSVYGKVNGKHLIEPTRHGLNFHEGKYGDQAVFVSFANQNNFHDALVEIGAVPGNNVTMENAGDKLHIEGQELEVTITWDGADKVYDINEVLIDSTGKPFVFKFGGNDERAADKFTGCMLCLDSCPVGITSNSSHPTTTFANKEAEFKGNIDVLPGDGTPVIITYKIK